MTRFIVLLRGINVNGRSLAMAELRAAAREGGFPDCVTYIQSGNLVLSGDGDAGEIERAIEALIEARFGMKVEAIARSAAEFERIAGTNPFPEAAPNQLHLGLTKRPVQADTAETLAARATLGEEIAVAGGALWINFVGGAGASKLTPAALDKAAGSTLTARNWNTVRKLIAMTAG